MSEFYAATSRELSTAYVGTIGFTMSVESLCHTIDQLSATCHAWNNHVGWWSDLPHYVKTGEVTPLARNSGEQFMLMVSEISEAMEGDRTSAMSDKIPEFTAVEEELADALIRILDYAGARQLRLGDAMKAKFKYNMNRPDHLLENRAKKGGKQY
jgi:NTP pyrophosphatase (non-canonical NTP hydrolase)